MTNRERLLKTLLCQQTDRAPFPMWLGFYPWGRTLARWRIESGIPDLDLVRHFGFEPFIQNAPIAFGPFPSVETRVLEETSEYVIAIDEYGITTRNWRDRESSMPEFLDHPVKTRADWDAYKANHLQWRLSDRLAYVAEFSRRASETDAMVHVLGFHCGLFGACRDMMGAEGLLYAFYDQPDLVRDIMSTYADLWVALLEKASEKIRMDFMYIWED
ncbi:MAG: uroporphyrinogen decarboxylase family protein, partial [Kiritimatiellae bacterium]|nr:uroporphyrinogen decarboxylase family protein [Kiritimatiellia bacterium]